MLSQITNRLVNGSNEATQHSDFSVLRDKRRQARPEYADLQGRMPKERLELPTADYDARRFGGARLAKRLSR